MMTSLVHGRVVCVLVYSYVGVDPLHVMLGVLSEGTLLTALPLSMLTAFTLSYYSSAPLTEGNKLTCSVPHVRYVIYKYCTPYSE